MRLVCTPLRESNSKVTLGSNRKQRKSSPNVAKKELNQEKSYLLVTFELHLGVTFSLLSGRPPESLLSYFFVTLNFPEFLASVGPLTPHTSSVGRLREPARSFCANVRRDVRPLSRHPEFLTPWHETNT